jgi:guanine deaminase
MHILDWLSEITFPHEARFQSAEYARKVYESAVSSCLRQGITTACFYASLHVEATKLLADVCLEKGLRAWIGKCCMDHPDTNAGYYREDGFRESLKGAREVVAYVKNVDPRGELVRPILTPRFAISCTRECLRGLGEILEEEKDAYGSGKGLLMQTHFCEAKQEVEATLGLFPEFKSEVDLYSSFGLLGAKSVLAHCTTVTEEEIQRMKDLNVGVAHCPVSNTTVGGGFMVAPIKKYLDLGIKVGLGTDSGGGYSSSLLDAMRLAVVSGNARDVTTEGREGRIGLEAIFYMGTLGGARVLGVGDDIGNFGVGKWFDAVVASTRGGGVMTETEEGEDWQRVLEKFIMTADDRNMHTVFVKGMSRKVG